MKKIENENKMTIKRGIWYVIISFLSCISMTIVMVCRWAKGTFNVGLNAIINTLLSPLKGTSSDTVIPAIKFCLPMVLIVFLICIVYILWDCKYGNKIIRNITSTVSILCVAASLLYVQNSYDVIGYIIAQSQETNFYKENYVSPVEVQIQEPEEKRNLLYIYLESMETTYADKMTGGIQEINYMPNCTELAKENISFSNTDKLGGFYTLNGATWTMGSLFSSSSGLPFAFPVDTNDMEGESQFASGVYTLGDYLAEQGYTQEFLCGSDAVFAGRKVFFQQHGDYEIFDLYTAREKGYIPEDYYVWWGFEDKILYEIAKDELLRLSAEAEPFNLTMLTVDAHHIGGYICELCDNQYDDVTANVISCADRQLEEFITWCTQQEFYENTTIVIVGDHPRMDTCLVEGEEFYDRTMYNCFINSVEEEPVKTVNREASMLDMFPTILTSMGYQIEGERLGLGVNLFSEEQTILEQFGREFINEEFTKQSSYYVERFAPELAYLVSDMEDSIFTVYFGEENYNASEYVKEGISECQGEFTWFDSEEMKVCIPIEEEEDSVHITIHILGANRSIPYKISQKEDILCEGAIGKAGVIAFEATVENGYCEFSLRIPYDELEENYVIEDSRTLKLTYITVKACD